MLGTLGVGTCDWIGGRLAGTHRALRDRLQRKAADALRVSPWQWAGRLGWLVGAGYAATVIVQAILRYGG